MATKPQTLPTGVQIHRNKLRIWFIYQGQRCYESMNLTATPNNIRAAERLRNEIVDAIQFGRFNYAHYFPDSKRAHLDPRQTFGQYAERWLKGQKGILAHSTWESYTRIMQHHWLPQFASLPIEEITATELLEAAAKAGFVSVKTRNNCLSPLKLLFNAAHIDGLIQLNPAARLKNQKIQKEPPDPFTLQEMEKILNHIKSRYHPQHLNYFEFAFFTGMRTSEIIALRWSDIDWTRATATVRRAKVRQQTKNTTKTAQIREVELGQRALDALNRQRQYTQLQNETIFHNPNTGKPYLDDRPVREWVWTPTLKTLGLRHRPAYATRHTRATMILMSGAQPAWGAAQLGHSLPVFLTIYARWINADNQGKELAKVEAHTTRQTNLLKTKNNAIK